MLRNKTWLVSIFSFWLMSCVLISAQEAEVFELGQIIHPRVMAMTSPASRPEIVGDQMMVSSPFKKTRAHVKQGFVLLYSNWDFEAYRHFSTALQDDPDCLLAYAGVAFSLAKPNSEYSSYRVAAINRMLDLIDADDARVENGEPERFPKVEKQFAVAVANLVSTGQVEAVNMFKKISEEQPHYTTAVLSSLLLSRGSYDVNGFPTPTQRQTIKRTSELLEQNPGNTAVHSFMMSLLAPAPVQHTDLRKEVFPSALFLTKAYPDVAPWQHALGHFLYQVGDYEEAAEAFRKTAKLYGAWMNESGASFSDCPGYIKAKCYLAHALYQHGDFDAAVKVAKELRGLKVDGDRLSSEGDIMLLWRAYTLQAHLYIARGDTGDMELAHRSLPDRDELKPYLVDRELPTFLGLYIEALSTYIGARKAIEKGNLTAAKSLRDNVLSKNMKAMSSVINAVQKSAEYADYYEASHSMVIYNIELSGLISLNGSVEDQVSATTWFYSALNKQGMTSLMLPAIVITPMENRLAEYYIKKKDYQKAHESYGAALKKRPNNQPSLTGAKRMLGQMQ